MPRDVETRTVTLVDIPLIKRLSEKAVVLDNEIEYTRETYGQNGAILSSILLPQRGLHTLVSRAEKQQVVGQFRLKGEGNHAHIVYIAPNVDHTHEDTAWIHVLDAMGREAGKQNAHVLLAEVNEADDLFETMRTVGFAVYVRQQIWRRQPSDYEFAGRAVNLMEIAETDVPAIHTFMMKSIPPLMQQIVDLPSEPAGWVYQQDHRLNAFFSMLEGKDGIYIKPYLHHNVTDVDDLFNGMMRKITRANTLPVYICVPRYQEWITRPLEDLGFEPGPRQAVMVKHIAARVRQAKFKPVPRGILAGSVKTPTGPLNR